MGKFRDHDDYIAAAAEKFHDCLQTLRSELKIALTDAEEIIAYDMPGFGYDGSIAAGYAAFSKQCGLYVAKPAIAGLSDEITAADLNHTKTGITFKPSNPIPPDLVRKLAPASKTSLECWPPSKAKGRSGERPFVWFCVED